jgi:hypothetical protein
MPSKQSSPSLFKPHGEVSFDMDGQILTVHMHGHWNLEMRDKAAEDLLTHIQALGSRGPWAIINCLHDTVVYSEEIFAATRNDYAARPASSQLTAVAFVIAPEVEGAVLLTRRFEQLLNGIITSQVFADLDAAKTWARDQIR